MTERGNGSRPPAAAPLQQATAVSAKELSTTELVRRAYGQVTTLVRDEIALARAELMEKSKKVGVGAGLFGAAGALAFFAIGCLIATAILALSLVWPAWLAALSVGVLLLVIAGVAVLVGRRQLNAATPPYPTEAAQGLTADLDAVKAAVQDRGHREH
jgi:uncharacterized membrane protein YqjE